MKTSEIESTHEPNLVKKDSDKDTHGNKNEPQQVKTNEIESKHEPNLLTKTVIGTHMEIKIRTVLDLLLITSFPLNSSRSSLLLIPKKTVPVQMPTNSI